MPESYQPGDRKKMYGQNHRITENRYAWVTTEVGKFLILVGNDSGSGSDVVLFSPRAGRVPDVSINLTNCTELELDALEDIFNSAFNWARTVVQRRDKEAQDAWNSGDDSHSRNYRAVPQLVYRKRPEWEHGEGVRLGSERVPEGGGGQRAGDQGGVRGAGDELVEPDSYNSESEDHRPSAD